MADRDKDFVSASLWFMPAIAVGIALVLGVVLAEIEIGKGSFLGDFVFQGGASEARQLLTVIAGTMITVTGLVFVLTVIALQIASSQFSPRLLRTFLRDTGTQVVLSTFVATFAYSLAGLHTVGRVDEGELFVPRLAITGALALALASVGMLVYYIHHITDSIRIDTIMRSVKEGTLAAFERQRATDILAPTGNTPQAPPRYLEVSAPRSGYVQAYRLTRLAEQARSRDAMVIFIHPVGHHVVEGRPLARVGSVLEAGPDPTDAEWTGLVAEAVLLRSERSVHRDPAFGVRQLVDIAIKAVGPSINDPYTAVQAIQHLSVILVAIAAHPLQPTMDSGPDPRVFAPASSFESYVELVCSHIRQEAANRPRVMVALLRLLEDVIASTTDPGRRAELSRQADLVLADARSRIHQHADLEELLRVADSIRTES